MDNNRFKRTLVDQQEKLLAGIAERDAAGQTVELDQSRVGRLSRMDALQMQAMAKAEQARAKIQLQRIAAALKRIELDDYGLCLECDEPIAPARLKVDPAAPLCIGCAERAA